MLQELTTEEKAILIQSLEKFEKSSRNWQRRTRHFFLGMICFLSISGLYGIYPVIQDERAGVDKQEIIDLLSSESIPPDVTADNWIVGYVNKTAVLSAHYQRIQSFELFRAIVGAIQLTIATLSIVFLVNRWNWGKA